MNAYLGLSFTDDYLLDHETRVGTHTVLFDQHRTGWNLLTHDVPMDLLAPIGQRVCTAPTPDDE